MNPISKITTAVLVLALLLPAAAGLAGDAPAPVQRVWAPEGDLIGLQNHWAASFHVLDQYGDAAKSLEDRQLGEEYSGSGLFSYRRAFGEDRRLFARGFLTSADGDDLTGNFFARAGYIGKRTLTVSHRGYNYFYDTDSEMRSSRFADGTVFLPSPVPPALDGIPTLAWCRNEATLRYHVTSRLDLAVGAVRSTREGSKGSLLREGTGAAAPGLKIFDTQFMEFWGGGAVAVGGLAGDLKMLYRAADGTRSLNDSHTHADDQKLFSTRLRAAYDINDKTRLLGHFVNSNLKNENVETLGADTYRPNTEARTNAGSLGLIRRMGQTTVVSASAAFRSRTLESRTNVVGGTRQYNDSDRTSQDYRLNIRHTGLPKTKIDAWYRYKSSELDGTTTAGTDFEAGEVETGDSQSTLADKTRQEVGGKARYRIGRKATLKARLSWRSEEVDQTETWSTTGDEAWFFWMGDRRIEQLRWRMALHTRPGRNLGVDLGHQIIVQDFERKGATAAETSWKTHRGFATAYWRADDILTLLGNVSAGTERFEMTDGPSSDGALGALSYDATTWRYAPGAVMQVSRRLQLEVQYEAVRFEDDGDRPVIDKLMTDYDRTTLRARWRLLDKTGLAASYRRYEFDENRWDDTINDLYSLSLTSTF